MNKKVKTWDEHKKDMPIRRYLVTHPDLVRKSSRGDYIYQILGTVDAKTASNAYDKADKKFTRPHLIFLDGKEPL